MYINKLIIFFLFGLIFAQVEMNYSYEMKYGNGKETFRAGTKDYSYFENLLDINTYYKNIYLYSQLEFSRPPIYGNNRNSVDSVISTFYLEYTYEKFAAKIGDLYELYGRGLSMYTVQDQNIDYDNSITGLSMHFFPNDNITFSSLLGQGKYAFRSSPVNRITDLEFINSVFFNSIEFIHDIFGSMQYSYLYQRSILNKDLIMHLYEGNKSDIGLELKDRCSLALGCEGKQIASEDTLYVKNHNFSWERTLGIWDIYVDKSWISYDKIHGDQEFGSRYYHSIYTELFGIGVTYEYKNYYTPYLIKSLSNPPIVYRESNSVLASRNSHSIDFGSEIGHQLDFNKNLSSQLNIIGNISISNKHVGERTEKINLIDVLFMHEDSTNFSYQPFRQIYLEINGWSFSDKLYYKLGIDHFTEFNLLTTNKNIFAFTIPTHWVYKFDNGSSVISYIEVQDRIVKTIDTSTNYNSVYLSVSYSHLGEWNLTGFYDYEYKSSTFDKWIGADISYKFNSENQISIFFGSQKGGLVCANGICAEQPGFEDGFKITFRSLF